MTIEAQHKEAYCVMKYQSKDGAITEYLWNSRDGVTPFCIHTADGSTELKHVNWHQDRYERNHVCKPGDRIFVDLTRERHDEDLSVYIEERWDQGMAEQWDTKEEAFAELTDLQRGEPDVYTVREGDHWTLRLGSPAMQEIAAALEILERGGEAKWQKENRRLNPRRIRCIEGRKRNMSISGWIGVDLDGTLARYYGWDGGAIGAPIPATVSRVTDWWYTVLVERKIRQ